MLDCKQTKCWNNSMRQATSPEKGYWKVTVLSSPLAYKTNQQWSWCRRHAEIIAPTLCSVGAGKLGTVNRLSLSHLAFSILNDYYLQKSSCFAAHKSTS